MDTGDLLARELSNKVVVQDNADTYLNMNLKYRKIVTLN